MTKMGGFHAKTFFTREKIWGLKSTMKLKAELKSFRNYVTSTKTHLDYQRIHFGAIIHVYVYTMAQ